MNTRYTTKSEMTSLPVQCVAGRRRRPVEVIVADMHQDAIGPPAKHYFNNQRGYRGWMFPLLVVRGLEQ